MASSVVMKQLEIVLTLNKEEALLLKGLLQNPQEGTSEEQSCIMEDLFNTLPGFSELT